MRDGLNIVTLPKAVLVLTKAEFVQALRRGKWWRQLEYLLTTLQEHHHQFIVSHTTPWRSAEDREAARQALAGSVTEARNAVAGLQGTRDPVLTGLMGKLIVQTELADGTVKDPSTLRC